jgi:Domain of unknown function (DUF4166)
MLTMTSLYRRILGPAFDTLPPALQQFHDVETEWKGHARFRITRGRGWLRNLAASAGDLPRAGEDVPLKLRVVRERDGERWIREFGGKRMESVQRHWNGLMVETVGTVTLGFQLVAEPPALRLVPVRVWILGVPWFAALGPHVSAVEIGRDDGCAIVVRAEAPLLGLLVQYEGLVMAE